MSEINAIAEKAAEEIYGHVNTDGFGGIDFERKEIVKIIEEAARAAIEAYEAEKRISVPTAYYFKGIPVSDLNREQQEEYLAYMKKLGARL